MVHGVKGCSVEGPLKKQSNTKNSQFRTWLRAYPNMRKKTIDRKGREQYEKGAEAEREPQQRPSENVGVLSKKIFSAMDGCMGSSGTSGWRQTK